MLRIFRRLAWLAVLLFPVVASTAPAPNLSGLWEAKRIFGPEVHGPLLFERRNDSWWADIAGYSIQAKVEGEKISFQVPGDRGDFRGTLG
jgi:hypothetical protein